MSDDYAGGRVQIESLTKRYGAALAVCGIDLDIPPGEFFCLLGPSGCGKTTTLRMIAGFERPSSGRMLLEGRGVSDTLPNRITRVNMWSAQLYTRNGPFSGSSPDSIIGLSS